MYEVIILCALGFVFGCKVPTENMLFVKLFFLHNKCFQLWVIPFQISQNGAKIQDGRQKKGLLSKVLNEFYNFD